MADYFQCTNANGKMSLEEYLGLEQHEKLPTNEQTTIGIDE
jgi:hypothetical protein